MLELHVQTPPSLIYVLLGSKSAPCLSGKQSTHQVSYSPSFRLLKHKVNDLPSIARGNNHFKDLNKNVTGWARWQMPLIPGQGR